MCNFSSPRYDGVWSDWRTTTYGESVSEEETLDLATDEDITSISGYSEDYDGDTLSLQAETSAARQWGPLGNHGGDRGYTSLRSSPLMKDRSCPSAISHSLSLCSLAEVQLPQPI